MADGKRKHRFWNRYTVTGALIAAFLLAGFTIVSRSLPSINSGLEQLNEAKGNILSNPQLAQQQFTVASETLRGSINSVSDSGPALLVAPLPPFRWQVRLNKAAVYLADAGSITSTLISDYPKTETTTDISLLLSNQSAAVFSWANTHQAEFDLLQAKLDAASTELNAVPSWILLTKKGEFEELRDTISQATVGLPKLRSALSELQSTLGKNDQNPHTVLILFQNDAELRPTGGFIGSYAVVTGRAGKITGFQFGTDIYKFDKPYMERTKIAPPDPLKTVTMYWSFHDSNTGFGFLETAAENIAKFYKDESGYQVDGIVFLDSTLLEDTLRITGPVVLPETDETVSAENITSKLTEYIDKDYYDSDANKVEMEPKKIINNLIPTLLKKVQGNSQILSQLVPALSKAVDRKSLQLWFENDSLESVALSSLPTDAPAKGNWVKAVNTNIGGLKSSRNIEQSVSIEQETDAQRKQLIQTITIKRTHTGSTTWPDGVNRNHLDIYLPKDAVVETLPKAIGGESQLAEVHQKLIGTYGKQLEQAYSEDAGEYVHVGFWATVEPGREQTFTLKYRLPLTYENESSLTYLKQAGSQNESVSVFGQRRDITSNWQFWK